MHRRIGKMNRDGMIIDRGINGSRDEHDFAKGKKCLKLLVMRFHVIISSLERLIAGC